AADAMPEDKYNFAPTNGDFKGVRTFGEQVRHVAAANYIIAAAILGEAKPPVDTAGESGPASMTSKADIMKYLKDSFAYMHKAYSSITSEQKGMEMAKNPFGPGQMPKMALVLIQAGHPFDHYGQMVEYLRMNNIIPPASRPRK
ncbi:MAG: DinB family protein, partial [Terriglobales bacterium]